MCPDIARCLRLVALTTSTLYDKESIISAIFIPYTISSKIECYSRKIISENLTKFQQFKRCYYKGYKVENCKTFRMFKRNTVIMGFCLRNGNVLY